MDTIYQSKLHEWLIEFWTLLRGPQSDEIKKQDSLGLYRHYAFAYDQKTVSKDLIESLTVVEALKLNEIPKARARQEIAQGAIRINSVKIKEDQKLAPLLTKDGCLFIQRGKSTIYLILVEEEPKNKRTSRCDRHDRPYLFCLTCFPLGFHSDEGVNATPS